MLRSITLEEAAALCRRHGLPLTLQRKIILEALLPRTDHPTADELLLDVQNRAPEISRTTVYRVLEAFVRIGVARKVCHPGAAARYEIVRDRHHHLVCLVCGRMVDFEDPRLDGLPLPGSRKHKFETKDYSIQFRGICDGCSRAASSGTPGDKRPSSGEPDAQRAAKRKSHPRRFE